jgi:hypothetical protein
VLTVITVPVVITETEAGDHATNFRDQGLSMIAEDRGAADGTRGIP